MVELLILLDTNVVLYYLGNRLRDPLPMGKYLVSVITEIELLSYPTISKSEELIVRDFLDKITVVGLTNNIKELGISFRKKHRLKLPDAIVAATAKSLNANLLTNDLKLRSLTEIHSESVSMS
ncbi:MAG: type II toxin-antitoxin system VapC family toxin [Roseofilum sp. SBFL]|nr:type II toxin-antitoxin system VapC family toxin [Roseofilum sp. SID3]MBP0022903.1 type II toxin-antitoxin system VapC family toxin [Roseofilum sp. SID2]MBP0037173.1 type II toxin-antitoxin system VapC family toxin [Roseofilum sp. SID1]MBP0041639.1 type II toxin-antitoxin system VapC family toxin [Roseofilum sp. SBFL]